MIARMQYRAVRVVSEFEASQAAVNTVLANWANAGWTLHSQSMTTFIGGGVAMSTPAHSTLEIVLLIFQMESEPPGDTAERPE